MGPGSLSLLPRQGLQQSLRLLQVSGVKPFGKPAVDLREQCAGFGGFALRLQETTQARRRPQLPRLRTLLPGNRKRLVKARLGSGRSRALHQHELAFDSIEISIPRVLPASL